MEIISGIWVVPCWIITRYQQPFLATLEQFERTAEPQAVYDALKLSTSTAIDMFAPDIADFRTLYKQEEAKHLQEPVLFEGAKAVLAKIVLRVGVIFWLAP